MICDHQSLVNGEIQLGCPLYHIPYFGKEIIDTITAKIFEVLDIDRYAVIVDSTVNGDFSVTALNLPDIDRLPCKGVVLYPLWPASALHKVDASCAK